MKNTWRNVRAKKLPRIVFCLSARQSHTGGRQPISALGGEEAFSDQLFSWYLLKCCHPKHCHPRHYCSKCCHPRCIWSYVILSHAYLVIPVIVILCIVVTDIEQDSMTCRYCQQVKDSKSPMLMYPLFWYRIPTTVSTHCAQKGRQSSSAIQQK